MKKILLLVVLLMLGAGLYWLQDANNLKPEIEKLINENSDYQVRINGDMDWHLWPPLSLRMADVEAHQDDQTLHAAELQMDMDLSAMWQNIDEWQITALHLYNTTLQQTDSELVIEQLDLMDFSLARPAPFQLTARWRSTAAADGNTSEAAAPMHMTLDGQVTFTPGDNKQPQTIKLNSTRFNLAQDTTRAAGVCEIALVEVTPTTAAVPAEQVAGQQPDQQDELLPLDILLANNIEAACQVASLTYANETFTQSRVELHNRDGKLHLMLDAADFFAGKLVADATVQLRQQPLQWQIVPEVSNVDSERLLRWAEQDLQWVAMIGMNGSMTLEGNTPASLANSVQAETTFDGGQGSINISKIKQQLAKMALLSGKSEDVAAWPDIWHYQDFTGDWRVDGAQHQLNFTLDNMQVDAEGSYNYLQESIDMLAHVIVHNAEHSPFRINPLLAGTAIPVRCRGDAADPQCKLDEKASRNIIAKALQRDDESGLRTKLEQKIDEEVPEEYRETARNLLELLGRSLQQDN